MRKSFQEIKAKRVYVNLVILDQTMNVEIK